MSDKDRPFHNPFEALRGLVPPEPEVDRPERGSAPPDGTAPSPGRPARPEPAGPARIARAVVRLERSGRGGKEVTVVEHLAIDASARSEWLKTLKAALGCGGSVDGDRLVLQGDQRRRLPALLEARGVKKVTVG